MKKNQLFTVVLAIAVVLGFISCYWAPNSDSGALHLDLTSLSAKGPGVRSVRVYLTANNVLYPIGDDTDYFQFEYNKQTSITLEDIPVGPIYRVAVSLGYAEPGWFDTVYWAESAAFEITPGTKVAVVFSDTELYSSDPFYPVQYSPDSMMAKKLLDVEVFSNHVYSTDGATLYELLDFDPYSPLNMVVTDAPAGQSINSVSIAFSDGAFDALCANTNQGIYSYNSFSQAFNSPPTSANLGPVSVLDSSIDDYSSGRVLFFRRAKGWGGTFAGVESSVNTWIWASQSSGRTTDMVVSTDSSGNAYFAASDGAFRVSGDYLYKISLGEKPDVSAYKSGFSAPSHILCLNLIDVGAVAPLVTLLMGTENGVWEATLGTAPDVIDPPKLKDGTQGFRFHRVIASEYMLPNFAAYLSDAYLFVWQESSNELLKYPIAAGLPGKITSVAWYSTGVGSYYLLVSGEEGLVYKVFSIPV